MKRTIMFFIGLSLTMFLQAQVSKTINVTSGSLSTVLTATELSTVTNLTLTDTIDARDFKTMRDNMPLLATIDLSGATIVGKLTFTATENSSNTIRTAKVTVSADGIDPQTVIVTQMYALQSLVTKIFDFKASTSGKLPIGALLESGDFIYGNTSQGGNFDFGTIFKIKKDGTGYTKLFDFKDSETGRNPIGQLTLIDNTLYGTTVGNDYFGSATGSMDYGCIFKINTDGSGFVILHLFDGTDGKDPNGSLVVYKGSLYGITNDGGTASHGTIFKINPDGTGFTKISDNTDTGTGENPYNGIIISNDVIYGVSTVDFGGVFSINIDGTGLRKLFEMNKESGDFSYCKPLLIDNELYITTSEGGDNGVGTIFKIKTDGTGFTVVYNFEGIVLDPESSGPRNNSLVYCNGMFYSTSMNDGINEHGYLYKIKPDGTNFTKLSDFNGVNGSFPYMCDLIIDKNNSIFGMTSLGGSTNEGIVYKYQINKTPTANAGADQSVDQGITVTLDGSASSDPDSNALSYKWTAPAGITLSSTTVAKPTFTSPQVSVNTDYTFSLVVNDGTVDSPADQVVITIKQMFQTFNVTAGGLAGILNAELLGTISRLKLIGTIDARDFKTMRDMMPNLTELDLSEVTVAAYSGNEGTGYINDNFYYPAASIPVNAFLYKFKITSITLPPSINEISGGAFDVCINLTSLNIPLSVTTIGEYSFSSCSSLTSVNIPSSVTTIPEMSFFGCRSLTSVNISSSVTSIGIDAFNGCSSLHLVNIPSSVMQIGDRAFSNCNASFTVDSNNPNYSSSDSILFNKTQSILIQFPTSKTGSYTIPSSVTAIGELAFSGCAGLTSVNIHSSVTSIGNGAFKDCSSLISVTIPPLVTSIGQETFSGCSSLNSFTIPSSVTSIGSNAFSSCSSMTSITIPASVTIIEDSAFSDFGGMIAVASDNPNYSGMDGILFNKTQTLLIQCPISKTGSYTIPSSVTSIGDYAFANCISLNSVIIPTSVTTIGYGTFSSCRGLTSVTIPSSVTSIGGSAFFSCDNLKSIYANNSTPINLSSSWLVFSGIDKTKCTLYVPFGSRTHYAAAERWKDFMNILEMPAFTLSSNSANIAAANGSKSTVELTSEIAWTVVSDQTWLNINPASGNGNSTLTFTAEGNPLTKNRTATITVSVIGADSQTITVTQESNKLNIIQDITMNIGWNIVSANVVPANLDLKAIFQSLIDAGKLKKVMDEAGKTIENFGAFGGWKNNIGNLNSAKGYKVNVTAASTLSLEGLPVTLPLTINLALGWNIISYPCPTAQDAKALVQPLIDGGQLKKVMDEAGKTIENFGAFGGWKNNIGNFLPGKGYKVNVTATCTLSVAAPLNKSAIIVPEVLASAHFSKVFTGNGTDHFNVHLVDLASSGLVAGDQIGIFDGKYCVGAATIGLDQLISGNISIPSSFNDEVVSGKVNGFTVGHPVTLQLYRNNQTYPLTPAKVGGSESFEKNGSLFLKVTASDLPAAKISAGADQMKCYPNPFSDQLTIEIRLTEPKKLEVSIYDLNGKLVQSLFNSDAGTSETLIWDGTNGNGAKMGSGTYILKANEMIEKIVLKK